MKKQENKKKEEDVKTDLKHDTMEFAADKDGDDKLDIDDESYEEEEITPEELDVLNNDAFDNQASALNAEEIDRQQDEDNLPEEDWLEDIPEINDEDEKDKEHRRK
jgi:hypothetical protein